MYVQSLNGGDYRLNFSENKRAVMRRVLDHILLNVPENKLPAAFRTTKGGGGGGGGSGGSKGGKGGGGGGATALQLPAQAAVPVRTGAELAAADALETAAALMAAGFDGAAAKQVSLVAFWPRSGLGNWPHYIASRKRAGVFMF